jgi:pilus assembly protein CpaD
MKNFAKMAGNLLVLGALSACATDDMHGNDPRDYYAAHPIKNSIETQYKSISVKFAANQSRLSPAEIDRLSDNLHSISVMSVDSIEIATSKADNKNEARLSHLKRMLRNMGYIKGEYTSDVVEKLKTGEMSLKLTYAVVVSPDCPDWRTSPTTTHSNTSQANFGCATEVNLGRMVADPHDLVRGSQGEVNMDTVTATKAIQNYHEGQVSSGSGGTSTVGSNSSDSGDSGSATGLTP